MKRMLRVFAFTGILGFLAAAAQAQVFVAVRAPRVAAVVAAPACPGVGYAWTPGYYAGAVFVPGRWVYGNGYRPGPVYAYRDYGRRGYGHDGYGHGGHDHSSARSYGRR